MSFGRRVRHSLCLFSRVYHLLTFPPAIEYDNSSVGEEERFAVHHIWAALSDWQIWIHILVYMSITGPREYTIVHCISPLNVYTTTVYGISLFLPYV